jgi:acyl-CoA reductase-like NAD-dependent aldehyde dehydrogenase
MAAQISISPHDLQPYCQRIQSTSEEVDAAITRAAEAQQWAAVPLAERIAIGHKFIEDFTKLSERIPQELTKMMGRSVFSSSRLLHFTPIVLSHTARARSMVF